MFLEMQDFDFVQIQLNFSQIQPNLPKTNQFGQKNNFAPGCGWISCIPNSYGTDVGQVINVFVSETGGLKLNFRSFKSA